MRLAHTTFKHFQGHRAMQQTWMCANLCMSMICTL